MPTVPIKMLHLQLSKRSTLQHEALWHVATKDSLTSKRMETSMISQLPGPPAVQRSALGSSVQLGGTPLYAALVGRSSALKQVACSLRQPFWLAYRPRQLISVCSPSIPACIRLLKLLRS